MSYKMPNMIRCYPLDRHGGMAVVSVDDPRGISYVRLDAMEQAVRQSCWMMWHMSGDDYNAEHGATEEEITDAVEDVVAVAADANRLWREAKAALEAAEKDIKND